MDKKLVWDAHQMEFIFRHHGRIDNRGIIHFPKSEASKIHFGNSVRYPDKRTLMFSGYTGVCLIFEGMHFVID